MNSKFKIPIDYLGFDRILFKSYEFLFFGDFDDSELDCSQQKKLAEVVMLV